MRIRIRRQIAQADVLLARETFDFPQEAAYQAAELIELISRALESFNCASRCRRTLRCTQSYIFAVPQFATAPFCWIQFRLLWACASLDFHLLDPWITQPSSCLYYLGHRAHPFSYLSLRPSSRRSLHLFLRSPSCSCWTTFNACYHDPRWV